MFRITGVLYKSSLRFLEGNIFQPRDGHLLSRVIIASAS